MIKIKVSTNFSDLPIIRQTPGSKGVWKDCVFFVNQDVDGCDWWFVYEDLPKPEAANCPPDHLVFITGEPPTTRMYDPQFLAQFSAVITSHTDLAHHNVILMQQALPWHIGTRRDSGGDIKNYMNIDDFFQIDLDDIKKSKLVSVISSDKKFTRGHRQRLKFIDRLLNRIGDQVDVYGRGYREVEDKWQAIAPYKYHLALENSAVPHYFTEKLSDAYLGWSYPIYFGCPNVADYFPPLSLSTIDITDMDRSIADVECLINSNTFERNISHIEEARNLVLFRYNMFSLMADYSREHANGARGNKYLYPEKHNRDTYSRLKRIYQKTKHYGFGKIFRLFQEKYL